MLKLVDIEKEYKMGQDSLVALKGISLEFRKNEFVSVLGPSGCGKTTLLNVVGGLDNYQKGDLIIKGRSTKQFKDKDWDAYRNHSIGFVFQSYNLISHLSVLGNVEMALTLSGIKAKERKQRAVDVLKRVGLETELKKKPNQLSGGQMQRVAIARALVNNPEILLADEPTGALDTKTSLEVMELIKEISKERLVIMVTHNPELAEKYSSRIIKLLDGKVVDDSMPYKSTKKEQKLMVSELNKENEKPKKKASEKKRTSMSLWTAMSLSFRNLISKKGRTVLTSIAGSIGIVGICLVLAVSNGFTSYINTMQSEALGGYPISVNTISVDNDAFGSMPEMEESEEVDDDVAIPYDATKTFITFGHYNLIGQDFLNEVEKFEKADAEKGEKSEFNMIEKTYFTPLKMVFKNTDDTYNFYQTSNKTSILSGSQNDTVYPILSNIDYVMSQYELIYGSLPQKADGDLFTKQLLLVVEEGNKISTATLKNLGFEAEYIDGDFKAIDFEEICSKEYKLLFNNDYYTADNSNFESITSFEKLDTTSQTALSNAYASASETLKISGVIRIKKDAKVSLLTNGVAYMPDLGEYYRADCETSTIALKQKADKNVKDTFYDNYVVSVTELGLLPESGFPSVTAVNHYLTTQFGYALDYDEAFELAMQQIGVSDYPTGVFFYPKNFDSKDSVVAMIESFNARQTVDRYKIVYTDSTGFLTDTLGKLISTISYVLIAFASISLLVSSIMIGIITYVSVIERTKEIGLLRSVGARKKDIVRVFNSETFIIGLTAGIFGAGISLLLTIPINLIVAKLATDITKIAIVKFSNILILTGISVVLSLISGLIPARMASKKDPVVALRTE